MKKIIFLTIAICLAFFTSVRAQDEKAEMLSFTDKFLQGFKTCEDDFSIVKISPQMFKMMLGKTDEKSKEGDLLKNLKGMYILSYEKGDESVIQKFNQQIKAYTKDYEALIDIKDGKDKVQLLTKSKNGKITDFVMVASELKGFTLINILGEIDLNALASLKSVVNVKELDQLDKLDNTKK